MRLKTIQKTKCLNVQSIKHTNGDECKILLKMRQRMRDNLLTLCFLTLAYIAFTQYTVSVFSHIDDLKNN